MSKDQIYAGRIINVYLQNNKKMIFLTWQVVFSVQIELWNEAKSINRNVQVFKIE